MKTFVTSNRYKYISVRPFTVDIRPRPVRTGFVMFMFGSTVGYFIGKWSIANNIKNDD